MRTSASLATELQRMGTRPDKLDDGDLVSMVEGRVQAGIDSLQTSYYPRWIRTLYFMLGFQNIQWSSRAKRYYPILLQPDQRITVNLMRGTFVSILSQLIGAEPSAEVYPKMIRVDARELARMTQRILRHIAEEADLEEERIWLEVNRVLFGGGFLKAGFDPSAGPVKYKPATAVVDGVDTGEKLVDENGKPAMIRVPPEGKVSADVRSHFEVVVPPSLRRGQLKHAAWVAEKRAVPVDEIRRRFGVAVDPDKSAIDITSYIQLDLGRFFEAMGRGDVLPFSKEEGEDSAWVYEMHCKAEELDGFEEGLRVVTCAGKLLALSVGEISDGSLPYEYFPLIPAELMFHGSTFLEDMPEPNMAYNTARRHLNHARQTYAYPYTFYREGTVDPAQITSGGRLIKWTGSPGEPPPVQMSNPAPITQAVVAELQAARADAETAGRSYSFSRGEPLGASPQPVGTVQSMIEADMSELTPGTKLSRAAWARFYYKLLQLVKDHYREGTERVALLAGETEDPDVFKWGPEDISLEVLIAVKQTVQNPAGKAAMRAQLAEIMKSGMLAPVMQDPAGMAWLMDIFEMPAPDSMMSLGNLDMIAEMRHINRIAKGEPVQIEQSEDHKVRLQVIARFKKTSEWEGLDDQIREAIRQHEAEHQQILEQQMRQQMQRQIAMQQMAQGQGQGQPSGQNGPPGGLTGGAPQG